MRETLCKSLLVYSCISAHIYVQHLHACAQGMNQEACGQVDIHLAEAGRAQLEIHAEVRNQAPCPCIHGRYLVESWGAYVHKGGSESDSSN